MVTFRCKRSGNTVSFKLQGDIDGMRKHEGYEEIKETVSETPSFLQPVVTEVKKRGRKRVE